jgi:hypothetical protein
MTQTYTKYNCPIEQLGIKPTDYFYLQLFDKNGIKIDRVLRVKEDSKLHKMIKNSV